MAADSQTGLSQSKTPANSWLYLVDIAVFGCWVGLVSFILRHHEPWADESQAWLLARDLDLKTIWFHELRYEGTPGLWHTILWIVQHWFHAPYSALGLTGMLFATAGVGFILWKAPFPRPLRYLLVFSYVIVYQYAVVARSYNLLPLLLFAAAYFYGDRARPIRTTIALILLASVAVHGMLLALALGTCYLLELRLEWPALSERVHGQYMVCATALTVWFIFLFVILKPTPDVLEFAPAATVPKPNSLPPSVRLEWVITYAFFDQLALSTAFLLVAVGWCYYRRKLLPLVLALGGMTLFYVAVHGRPHHHGTVFLAVVAGLWIAWPTKPELSGYSKPDRVLHYGMVALLALLFCMNIWDAVAAMKHDYFYPYSGSLDAARFLKRIGAENTKIFGYTYGMSAVQAYFDHNILANNPTTYFHEGIPLRSAAVDLAELQSAMPEYVVQYSNADKTDFAAMDPLFVQMGYHLVHVSYGSVFYKNTWFDDDTYFIYKLKDN